MNDSRWYANPKNFKEVVRQCKAAGGGTVVLRRGTYWLEASLRMPAEVRIRGEKGARLARWWTER